MKHFIAFCRRNRLFAALLAAELAVVCALAAGLFGAPYKLALTPGDFTNTLPDIAAAYDDCLKIWNQIDYHSDDPMTFSADNIALPSGAYEVTVRYFSCQTPDAPTFNMLNAAGSLTFASERSPAAKHLYTATGFAVLTLVLSLHAFPWDFVEGWFGPAVGKVVGMFQFPFRFLSLGTLLLCAAALFALQLLPERRAALAAAGLVCAALLTASITETNIMSAQGESSYATYNQNATINSVGTAEYLIDGTSSYEAIWAQPKPASGDLHLVSYEKREGVAYVSVENDGGEAAISLPIYNYGNYYAADESGAPFAITSGENMRIVLTIPAGYTGTIHVRYHAPGYWRAFEALSAVSLLGVIGCGAFARRKRRTPATV